MAVGCVQTEESGSNINETSTMVAEPETSINVSDDYNLESAIGSTESVVNDAITFMDVQGTDAFDDFRQK
ncbi:MAG: hypothetical protein PWQ50_169, partial [Methanolobus sp.]|nr:hypothetical protein [Methanolobus sp.]